MWHDDVDAAVMPAKISDSQTYRRLNAEVLPWFRGGPYWETKEQAAQRRIASFWGMLPAFVAVVVVTRKISAGPDVDQTFLAAYTDQGWASVDALGFAFLGLMVFLIESRGRALACMAAASMVAFFDVLFFLESHGLSEFSWSDVAISGSIVLSLVGLGLSDAFRAWAVYEKPELVGAQCHQCPHLYVTCCGVKSIGLVTTRRP